MSKYVSGWMPTYASLADCVHYKLDGMLWSNSKGCVGIQPIEGMDQSRQVTKELIKEKQSSNVGKWSFLNGNKLLLCSMQASGINTCIMIQYSTDSPKVFLDAFHSKMVTGYIEIDPSEY